MHTSHLIKIMAMGLGLLTLTACSHHHAPKGAPYVVDANGPASGADGAYTQGLGDGNSGFQGGTNCDVPKTPGFNTASYYFDFNSNAVPDNAMSSLQNIAQNAAANNGSLRVVGNTDDRGSREFNMALGWRRANAVAAVLQQNGTSKRQILADSNGAEKPIAYGKTEDDYQCNRRVDVISH